MGGRAGGGAGAGKGGGFGGITERGLSAKEARTVLIEEAGIRGNNYETGIVVDGDGNIVVKVKGDATHVSIPSDKIKDNIVTHNHPATYKDEYGNPLSNQSFSLADIKTSMIRNAKGVRVVTAGGYRYTIMRPEGGWKNISEKGIKAAYTKAQNKVYKSLQSYIVNGKGDYETSVRRATHIASHLVNKELAKSLGYKYTKSKIK